MKNLIIFWILLGSIGYGANIAAQSALVLEASQLYASFKFTDSQGNILNKEYSGIFTGSYGAGYRYITDFGLMINAGIGMRKAGATLVNDDMNYYWDLQYANAKLGAGYILMLDMVAPYLNVAGYYAYMVRGYQTLNNENFNITDSGSMNLTDYGLYFTPGIQISLSDAVSAFIEANYLMGLQNLDKDENQEALNYAYGLTVGLSFSFLK